MEQSNIDTAAAVCAPLDFTADRAEFAAAVAFLAARVVEGRNTIPILSYIMLQADMAGTVTLTGTDLDLAATVTLAATVEAPGAICLSADVLADGLKKAKGDSLGMVRLQEADGRATVTAGRVRFKLPAMPVDDFPMIAAPTGGTDADGTLPAAFTLPAAQLVADMAALAPCVSKEESRYYLNGVALQRRDMAGRDCLVMVATDGHSLGAVSRHLPAGADVLPDVIFPRKAAGLVKHIAKLAGPVDVADVICGTDGRKLALTMGNVALVAKLIDGTFPDWQRLFVTAAPTGEGDAPMFPELLPGAPTAAIERIGKACPVPLSWETRGNLFVGSAADDGGLIYAAMCCDPAYAGVKGFSFTLQGKDEARDYLLALAAARGLPSPEAMEAACEVINAGYLCWNDPAAWEATGDCRGRIKPYGEATCRTELVTRGGRVLGLTVEGQEARRAWCEIVTNWETLHESAIYHPDETVALEGSYSILMPADGPGQLTATGMGEIIGPDGVAYPVADDGRKIHLSAAQVKALMDCPESWAVVEFPGPDGKPRYVNRDEWEAGAPVLTARRKDGRVWPSSWCSRTGRWIEHADHAVFTRGEIEAAMAGEPVAIKAAPIVEMEVPGAIEEIQREAYGPPVTVIWTSNATATGLENPNLQCFVRPLPADAIGDWVMVAPDGRWINWRPEDEGRCWERVEAPASAPESAPQPVEAVTGRADAVETPHGPEIGQNGQSEPDADPIAAILARLDAIEATLNDTLGATAKVASPLPAESTASGFSPSIEGAKEEVTPSGEIQPKRTPAHERAIRRAWAERRERLTWMRSAIRHSETSDRQSAEYRELDAELQRTKRQLETLRPQYENAAKARTDFLRGMNEACERERVERWKRKRAAERARRMVAYARGQADLKGRALDAANAAVARLKRDMADPTQPERASDIARLVRERDEARTANAALQARAERAEASVLKGAEAIEMLASRVAVAEAKLRRMTAAA